MSRLLPTYPQRRWQVLPPPPLHFARSLGLPLPVAASLWHRGLRTPSAVATFLSPPRGVSHDPFLLPQMDRAVHRILRALLGGETIAIYGDFDTDGVTATALLVDALQGLGARVLTYLPDRLTEGHGLNRQALQALHQQGATLVITVDTGITGAIPSVEARPLGLDLIITDHHLPPKTLPQAVALVSPWLEGSRYPFVHLTGAGLALKLAQALYHTLQRPLPAGLLELAALGTIADMGLLTGENRAIVREGLAHLRQTHRPGLLALCAAARVRPDEVSAETVSFVLAPRLNAAGRLASAALSLHLLLAPTAQEAIPLAQQVERLNDQRQRLTDALLGLALERLRGQPLPPLLFIRGEEFVPGVNGLVAAALVEAFYRPAVVASQWGDRVRASARSIPEVHIGKVLEAGAQWLDRFGGHAGAGGFECATDAVPTVQDVLARAAHAQMGGSAPTPTLVIDAEATFTDMLGVAYHTLGGMAPFGPGNPEPLFLARGVEVVAWRLAGDDGQHLLLRFRQGRAMWDAVGFRLGRVWGQGVPAVCDVVFTPDLGVSEGSRGLRLLVRDLRPSA
ncbi:MAG: single-stranded-DNA-specific exonuclease RecJ [Chloroflexota bacterium]|nr:single-stranded-DNA-specific exonuclease RecJ [Chloroflexota bacterium]